MINANEAREKVNIQTKRAYEDAMKNTFPAVMHDIEKKIQVSIKNNVTCFLFTFEPWMKCHLILSAVITELKKHGYQASTTQIANTIRISFHEGDGLLNESSQLSRGR
jgi:hypothetical protein